MPPSAKWIDQIVRLQQPDGSWGCLHSLSRPTKECPITTEQALRRLWVLGLTGEDAPIQRALAYMRGVLAHRIAPPDRREKGLNWDFFEQMILATWIRRFLPRDEQAQAIAALWAGILQSAFAGGTLDPQAYEAAYRQRIPRLHAQERLIGIPQFYMVTLLWEMLDRDTECAFVDYLIHHPGGIYYIYNDRVAEVPPRFDSPRAGSYITALECLSGYRCAPEKLRFAVDWLLSHQREGGWDLGASAKDGIYFPTSDSWRTAALRQKDCTERITRLLRAIVG